MYIKGSHKLNLRCAQDFSYTSQIYYVIICPRHVKNMSNIFSLNICSRYAKNKSNISPILIQNMSLICQSSPQNWSNICLTNAKDIFNNMSMRCPAGLQTCLL